VGINADTALPVLAAQAGAALVSMLTFFTSWFTLGEGRTYAPSSPHVWVLGLQEPEQHW
jgi:hypothetical protein